MFLLPVNSFKCGTVGIFNSGNVVSFCLELQSEQIVPACFLPGAALRGPPRTSSWPDTLLFETWNRAHEVHSGEVTQTANSFGPVEMTSHAASWNTAERKTPTFSLRLQSTTRMMSWGHCSIPPQQQGTFTQATVKHHGTIITCDLRVSKPVWNLLY